MHIFSIDIQTKYKAAWIRIIIRILFNYLTAINYRYYITDIYVSFTESFQYMLRYYYPSDIRS